MAIAVGDVGSDKRNDKVQAVLGDAAIMDQRGTVHRGFDVFALNDVAIREMGLKGRRCRHKAVASASG